MKTNGNWITAYIELPEGYDVADIKIDTVILEGVIFAEEKFANIGDNDKGGIPDLMVKFDRQALIEYLGERRGELTLMIHGELDEVTHFEGSDIINVK